MEKCLDPDPVSVNPDPQQMETIQRVIRIPNLQNLLLQRFLGLHINSLQKRLGPAAVVAAAAGVAAVAVAAVDIANILQLFHLHGRIPAQL